MSFESFIDDIKRNQWNVYGAELYADDKLIHHFGDTYETRYPIYSATKTITSIAAGMAADEGRLDIGRSILAYLPKKAMANMPRVQLDTYRHITLRRLLTMSVSGYPFRPETDSWLTESLNCPIDDVRRREFHYSNISAYLAGVAVSCAVQENLYEYLHRKLFAPLDIHRPPCTFCPDGYFYGASGMHLTVNELSRIGMLLYNGGVYDDQRLLSEQYAKEASSIQQMNREGGYGYFLWKYRSGFSINGKWGQKCYILPDEKLMITFLSHMENGSSLLTESMEKHLLGR